MEKLPNHQSKPFKLMLTTLFTALISVSIVACNGGSGVSSGSLMPVVDDAIIPIPTPSPTPIPTPSPTPTSNLFNVVIHGHNDSGFYTDKSSAASYQVVEIKNISTHGITINSIIIPNLAKIVNDSEVIPVGKKSCSDNLNLAKQGNTGDSCLLVLNADGKFSNHSDKMEIKTDVGNKKLNLTVQDEIYMTGLKDNDLGHRSLARWDGSKWNFSELSVSRSPLALDSYGVGSPLYDTYMTLSLLTVLSDGSLATLNSASSPNEKNTTIIGGLGKISRLEFIDRSMVISDQIEDLGLANISQWNEDNTFYHHGYFNEDGNFVALNGLGQSRIIDKDNIKNIIIDDNDSTCYVVSNDRFIYEAKPNDDQGIPLSCDKVNGAKDKLYYGNHIRVGIDSRLAISKFINTNDGNLIMIRYNNYMVLTKDSGSSKQKLVSFKKAKYSMALNGDIYVAMVEYDSRITKASNFGTYINTYTNPNLKIIKFGAGEMKEVAEYSTPMIQNTSYFISNHSEFNLAIAPKILVSVN